MIKLINHKQLDLDLDALRKNRTALLLAGPTGIGKSKLAMEVAKKYDGEIVSIDSCAVYREFDIGSAKPSKEEMEIVPHHLINILDPYQNYSVGDFFLDANTEVENIIARNKLPILVGGTMMYINALLNGLVNTPTISAEDKKKARDIVEDKGVTGAYLFLKGLDRSVADRLHPNDTQRVTRALEIYLAVKNLPSGFEAKQKLVTSFDITTKFLLPDRRDKHMELLRRRFKDMLDAGLINEVKAIVKKHGTKIDSLRAVGYRQLLNHAQGYESFAEAAYQGELATTRLAKRQMTWIRKFDLKEDQVITVSLD